jgi:hypothetical protein
MQRTSDVRLVPEADTWSVGFAHRLWVLRRLTCGRASRRLPKLRGRRLPIKRVIAWTVLIQVLNPPDRLLDARPMAGWHPPHHEILVFKMLEPFGAAAVKLLVNGLVDEALERRDALPDGQVDGDLWIGIGPRTGGVAALVDVTPNGTRRPLGQTVHQREIVREICHAWIVDLVSNAADVQLRKMMIGWLLQRSYSVADERDEIAPSHCLPQGSGQGIVAR